MSDANQTSTDKLDMQSPDLVQQNIEKLAELFPNCVTEGATGKAIDFDLLKQELNHDVVEGNKERYRLEWPGKREAIVTANLPTTKTLRPVREDSVDFDNTENIYIEGDNLEVLKLLQESYLGKIKMIYIDPPYNTGKDFVYKDNFAKDKDDELFESGQKNELNQRLVLNPETSGKYHSDWLTMMYPRLKLARNLLAPEGLFLISIGEEELHNLRKICDEIFGEKNFYGMINWTATTKSMNAGDAKYKLQKSEEFIYVYGRKTMQEQAPFKLELKDLKTYPELSSDGRKFRYEEIQQRKNIGIKRSEKMVFKILGVPPSENYRWTIGEDTARALEANNDVVLLKSKPTRKIYEVDEIAENYYPLWINFSDGYGTSETGKSLLRDILQGEHGFETVKPVDLIVKLLFHFTSNDDLVLDFFCGSATTAHAVNKINSLENSNRKYICAQVPELIKPDNEGYKLGYQNICELGKERIRRAAKKIKEDTGADIDYGFRVYRLDESNMQDVYYRPQELDQAQMDAFADNVKPDRTEDDLLAQVMLDWGLPLSLKIEQLNVAGKKVFKVAENSLIACFDKGVDEAFAKEISREKPLRIVFKDAGFKGDTEKTNVKQLLKQLSPETEMKVL